MLPSLSRFYFECMLPEILDSRYNRNMPIRNPKYIIETKEKLSKSRNIKWQKINPDISQKNKRLKCNTVVTETTNDTVAITAEQEDCIIVSHLKKQYLTADDVARRKKNFR